MKRSILFIILLFIGIQIVAQTDSTIQKTPTLEKNSFYLSLGAGTEFYFTGKIAYEYLFWQSKNNTHIALGVQVGFGYYAVWGIGGPIANINLVMLTGGKKSHLEIAGGTNIFLGGDLIGYTAYRISAALGYRYQNPNGGFLFRVGTGWPEVGYIGLGYNF